MSKFVIILLCLFSCNVFAFDAQAIEEKVVLEHENEFNEKNYLIADGDTMETAFFKLRVLREKLLKIEDSDSKLKMLSLVKKESQKAKAMYPGCIPIVAFAAHYNSYINSDDFSIVKDLLPYLTEVNASADLRKVLVHCFDTISINVTRSKWNYDKGVKLLFNEFSAKDYDELLVNISLVQKYFADRSQLTADELNKVIAIWSNLIYQINHKVGIEERIKIENEISHQVNKRWEDNQKLFASYSEKKQEVSFDSAIFKELLVNKENSFDDVSNFYRKYRQFEKQLANISSLNDIRELKGKLSSSEQLFLEWSFKVFVHRKSKEFLAESLKQDKPFSSLRFLKLKIFVQKSIRDDKDKQLATIESILKLSPNDLEAQMYKTYLIYGK